MKKYIIIILLIFPFLVSAETERVRLSRCVDGDTAVFNYRGKDATFRFLAIDTPESKKRGTPVQAFAKEAAKFTCQSLERAELIEVEFDPGSDKVDRYNRYLAWVYTDSMLLQKEIVAKGYARVAYLYGDYLYTDTLLKEEGLAKADKKGIWGEEKNTLLDKVMEFIEKIIDIILKFIEDLIQALIKDLKKNLL